MEIQTHSGESPAVAAGPVELPYFDPILQTAGDRLDADTLPPLNDPAADHSDALLRARRADVEEKHRRARAFLDTNGLDAIVLGRPESLAWFTSGGDLGSDLGSDMAPVLLFINRNCRAVVTDNVQSARVFEEELAGLGFQFKERAWHADPSRVIDELSHNKRVACDLGPRPSPWGRGPDGLQALRAPLTPLERQRLRELGRTLTLAVEATCKAFERGDTEAGVAGQLAHRLLREGVVPVDLKVVGDDRLARYRQAGFKAAPILRRANVTASGRRFGLCVTVSRSVHFGTAAPEVRQQHALATMIDASCIFFSRPGEAVSEVLRRARRIYEKFEHAQEWGLDYAGFLVGYGPHEALLSPDCARPLEADTALCWSPSVGAARSSDTIVIDAVGQECVTAAQNWPQLDVSVKGHTMSRPAILERPARGGLHQK